MRVLTFLSLFLWGSSLARAASDCNVLVGGSNFLDVASSDTLWISDFNLIKQIGPSGNSFSSAYPTADSAQMFGMDTAVYTITSNPHLLDTSFVRVDQHMFVVKPVYGQNVNTKLFGYSIPGLKAGSSFTIKFKVCNLLTDTSECAVANPWANWKVRAVVNPDAYGSMKDVVIDDILVNGTSNKSGTDVSTAILIGKPGADASEVEITGTLTGEATTLNFQIWPDYNLPQCTGVGIYDLEVHGCYKPKVKSSQGLEICRGEQTLISLSKEYYADSYKWMKSVDGGSTFTEVGSSSNLYEEIKEEQAMYYCIVNGVYSDTLTVNTIICCVDESGNPMSRMNVFYEDFGHFTDAHVYVDADGNTSTTPSTYIPYRTDTRFSMPEVQKFDATGGINDGSYGVVVPTSQGYANDLTGNSYATWMNGVTSDHTSMITGEENGAALFINVALNFKSVIFSTQIDELCAGKNLYFETYIANMSGGTDPEITLNIKDLSGNVLAKDTKVATAGEGWIRVHIDELQLPVGTTSVILEVVSTGGEGKYQEYWDKGNDLVIDDIKFMVCSPPSVDIYSNLDSYASDTTICANTDFTMGSPASDLLKGFYGGTPYYLYQQSSDGETWKNISAITDKNSFTFNTEDYPADTNYFRVVVAKQDGLQTFLTNPSDADFEDKCRSYSISKPFAIYRAGKIDLDTDVEQAVCGGTAVHLVGTRDARLEKWSWKTSGDTYLVNTTSDEDAKSLDLKLTQDTTLYFTAYNAEGCFGTRKFEYTIKPTVELELETAKQCGVTLISAKGTLDGTEFTWEYGGESYEKTTVAEFEVEAGSEDKELIVTAELDGYCASDTVKIESVDVLTFPDAPTVLNATQNLQSAPGSTFDVISMLDTATDEIDETTGSNVYQWSLANNGVFTDKWTDDNPSVDLSAAGVYDYFVRLKNASGCLSDTVHLQITVLDVPVPTITTDSLCLGTSIDFTAYATASEGFDLVWYESNEDDAAEVTPSALTPEAPGAYVMYVAQKKVVGDLTTLSAKMPVSIAVIGVSTPSVSPTSVDYCLNDPTVSIETYAITYGPKINGYYSSGLKWYVDEAGTLTETDDLIPASTQEGTVTYAVKQYYLNSHTVNGDVCYGDTIQIKVNTNNTEIPTSNDSYTVSYIKSDGEATGAYADVVTKSGGDVAVAAEGCELVWYDANKVALSAAPAPVYDAAADEDVTYTYYVSQKNTTTGCESELTKVTVNVSTAPCPTVKDVYYCEGDTPEALTVVAYGKKDASDDESNYTLTWYSENPKENPAAAGSASITPVTTADANLAETIHSYYVVQTGTDGSQSSPVELKVHVYTKPVISTDNAAVCLADQSTVDLSRYYAVNTKTAGSLTAVYADASNNPLTSSMVDAAGDYSVYVTFTLNNAVCTSTTENINVKIDYLTNVSILETSVCPGMAATLKIDKDALQTNVESVSYAWAGSNGDAKTESEGVFTTSALGKAGDSYKFSVTATAGLCSGVVAYTTVNVGNGVTKGTLTFDEADNTESGASLDVNSQMSFYSCGSAVKVNAAVDSYEEDGTTVAGDYVWTNMTTKEVVGSNDASVSLTQTSGTTTYRLSYTNICPTYVDFTVTALPITVTEVAPESMVICEGDPFNAEIKVDCDEKANISWSLGSTELTAYANSSKVAISKAAVSDKGVYSYKVTNRGCSYASEYDGGVALNVKPYIQISAPVENYVARADSSLTLTVNVVPAEVQYIKWNGEEDAATHVYKVTEDKTFNIVASDVDYCSDSTTITVQKDGRLALEASIKDSVCYGNSDTLKIDTTGTGRLLYKNKVSLEVVETVGDKVSTRKYYGTNMTFIPTDEADYVLTYTYREGEGVDEQKIVKSFHVKVLKNIQITAPTGLAVCEGDPINIALTSVEPEGTVVNWEADPTISSGLTNTESIEATPTYDGTGNYYNYKYTYNATYSICSVYSGVVTVRVDKALTGSLEDVTVCEGNAARLDASTYNAKTYEWSADNLEESVNAAGLRVKPEETTTYFVKMTRGECSASDKATVIVNKAPVISYIDSLAYRSVRITIDAATGTEPFQYSVDEKELSDNNQFDNLKFGPHTAYVIDAAGCSTTYDFNLPAPGITPSSILTPNGDGVNDTWQVDGLSDVYPEAEVVIYDRYGKKLVTLTGSQSWDGTYNGNPMPTTDYWYEIKIGEIDRIYTGHFTLLRQ